MAGLAEKAGISQEKSTIVGLNLNGPGARIMKEGRSWWIDTDLAPRFNSQHVVTTILRLSRRVWL